MKISSVLSLIMIFLIMTVGLSFGQLTGQIPIAGMTIPKYVEPLPHFAGIRQTGTNITVSMHEFQQKVLPASFYAALPDSVLGDIAQYKNGTIVWGYKVGSAPALYPGFTIEAVRGTPTTVTYVNSLPEDPLLQNYLYIDQTLHWAAPFGGMGSMDPYANVPPAVVHLHGGEVPSEFDGGPDQWFTPTGIRGAGYRSMSGANTNEAIYEYPNTQEATTLWFHDHTLGATRINVYAGLAAFYFLRDAGSERSDLPGGTDDAEVTENSHFSGSSAQYEPEIEIVVQDRMFDTNGQLFFPNVGINPEHPFWIPEFLGDVIVVNGKTWPFLEVEPRRYRFRFLNGSNARFYNIWLENLLTSTMGPAIWQIGSDGGMLDFPANMPTLLMAPGERFDLIIDFAGYEGQTLTVRNNARSPYPKGETADPQTVGQIMQFRVGTDVTGGTDNSYNPASGGALRTDTIAAIAISAPDQKRQLTLNEVMGAGGPLEVLVNNTKWAGQRPDGGHVPGYEDGQGNILTELPLVGSTEVWQVINLTADAHPIHLHLVQYQLVSRQNFNVNKYGKAYNAAFPGGVFIPAYGPPIDYFTVNADGAVGGNPAITPYLQGMARLPAANENGWKDTIIMYPGQVTTIAVRFTPQDAEPTTAGTNLFAFDPTTGPGYVWHCHIIDHEDNEMMRPYNLFFEAPETIPAADAGYEVRTASLGTSIPESFVLDQNYPNPFNPSTQISFQMPEAGNVRLAIYNTLGQEVKSLVNGSYDQGAHQVTWDATDNFGNRVSSGIYIYRIESGNHVQQKKMMLLK